LFEVETRPPVQRRPNELQDREAMKVMEDLQRTGGVLNLNGGDTAQFNRSASESRISCGSVPVLKRSLDIFCLLLALPTLLPLMLGIAVLIKLVSPGPVFFTQERIGFMGRRFKLFKFRSMHVNAETNSHQNHLKSLIGSDTPMTKMDSKGDPRVIPCGGILRSSGLDELPQLINVARGEMSLVGPRPCTPYEYEQFQPWHKQRFRALPGLTGLWQVSGKNKTTFNQMINLDIQYANNWSLRQDLKIMLRTFPVLLGQIREHQILKPGEKK
jgi:lipopolysaccharide/colanic/teichoic acid biosynthesis glycosyltransferase